MTEEATKAFADDPMRASREHATAQGQAVEAYIRVFLERTGLSVDDVELVEQRHSTDADMRIVISWFVRRRNAPTKGDQ